MRNLCRHARALGLPLEINFLGIREKRCYPNEMFWEIAGEEGCDVIFGLDAHDTEAFQIADLVKKAEAVVERHHLHLLNDEHSTAEYFLIGIIQKILPTDTNKIC